MPCSEGTTQIMIKTPTKMPLSKKVGMGNLYYHITSGLYRSHSITAILKCETTMGRTCSTAREKSHAVLLRKLGKLSLLDQKVERVALRRICGWVREWKWFRIVSGCRQHDGQFPELAAYAGYSRDRRTCYWGKARVTVYVVSF